MDSIRIDAIASELHVSISGCTIDFIWASQKAKITPLGAVGGLNGWTFTSVIRAGKCLLFRLENPGIGNRYIANQLGLSGNWVIKQGYDEKKDVLVFGLAHSQGKIFLCYQDPRRFGSIEIRDNEGDLEVLRSYGPEIRSNQFTKEWVTFFIKRHRIPVKQILMRPEYCPGISNWVASEVLFISHIHPLALGNNLNRDQIKRLFEALHLGANGLTEKLVWDRAGKECGICRSHIKKIQVAKRGTYFCPVCQHKAWQPPKPVSKEFVEKIIQGKL